MIDPENITDYNLSLEQLEEHILFWVCAAGKNGRTAARCLEVFLTMITYNGMTPFEAIKNRCLFDNEYSSDPDVKNMTELMQMAGIGCYTHKRRTFSELAWSKLNLKTCTVEDLEQIYGIGMKTARCFIIHSRYGARHAGLDTHLLKYLKAQGVEDVPKATPSSKKQYLRLEKEFLRLADDFGKTPSVLDLEVWNKYSIKNTSRS